MNISAREKPKPPVKYVLTHVAAKRKTGQAEQEWFRRPRVIEDPEEEARHRHEQHERQEIVGDASPKNGGQAPCRQRGPSLGHRAPSPDALEGHEQLGVAADLIFAQEPLTQLRPDP